MEAESSLEKIVIKCICHSCKIQNVVLLNDDNFSFCCKECNEVILTIEKQSGYIYVASNPSIPNLYKVGFSMNHPDIRLEQLSNSTSIPTKFESELYFSSIEARAHELEIHNRLSEYRSNQNREFFKTNLYEIYLAVKEVTGKSPFFYRAINLDVSTLKTYNPWVELHFTTKNVTLNKIRCIKCNNLVRHQHPKMKANAYGYCKRCKLSYNFNNEIIS